MKKIMLQTAVIAAMLMWVAACQSPEQRNVESTKYFRLIQFGETPWEPIQGIYPISEKDAKTTNHYRYTYDENSRLVRIDFCRDTLLLPYSVLGAATIKFDYLDNTETRTYADHLGLARTVSGKVAKAVFERGDDGKYTSLKFYDTDGNPVENRNKIARYKWEMLADGMLKEHRYNLAEEEVVLNEFCPFYELRFRYNEKGHILQMANYQADTLYDCTVENCGDVGVSYFEFSSTEEGGLLKFTVRNSQGLLSNLYWGWAHFEQKLDPRGYVLERAYLDQDEEYPITKMVPVRGFVYDAHGAVTEIRNLDGNRQLMNDPNSGVALIRYGYETNGMPRDTMRFSKDNVQL